MVEGSAGLVAGTAAGLSRSQHHHGPAPRGHRRAFRDRAGPLVTGTTLALTTAMAGRLAHVDDLAGPGVPTARARGTSARPLRPAAAC